MNWLGNGSDLDRDLIQQMLACRFQEPVDIHCAHVLVFLSGSSCWWFMAPILRARKCRVC